MHAAVRDGGLGVPHLEISVLLQKQARVERLLSSESRVLKEAGRLLVASGFYACLRRPIRAFGEVIATKLDARSASRSSRDFPHLNVPWPSVGGWFFVCLGAGRGSVCMMALG